MALFKGLTFQNKNDGFRGERSDQICAFKLQQCLGAHGYLGTRRRWALGGAPRTKQTSFKGVTALIRPR